MMGSWCPFTKKKCNKDCVFYRSGLRYFDDGRKPEPFEECAFNIIADCLENLVQRSIGQQKATEQVRNQINQVGRILWQGMELSRALGKVEECPAVEGGTVIPVHVAQEVPATAEEAAEAKAEAERNNGR